MCLCASENLLKNPSLNDLVGGVVSVTLGDDEARRRRVQKSVLEREGPPTFGAAVEMNEIGQWRVHLDVGGAAFHHSTCVTRSTRGTFLL